MKHNKSLFIVCAAAMALASCVSEDITKVDGNEAGRLAVSVETLQPLQTRADVYSVTNFPVTIYKEDGTTKVESYDAVSVMPAQILLPTGTYVLEAHTPGVMQPIMNAPYYIGTETSTILKDATTESTITCKQANTSVTVRYDDDFLSLFTAWTITFDDGTSNALSFSEADGSTPATLYWDLGEGVEKLTVNFRGTNKDGTVTANMILTKSQATETYDGESTNFAGGDAIVVNFKPTEATTGYATVSITASIFGIDSEEEVAVTVEVVDNGTFTPGTDDPEDPGEDPNPGDDDPDTIGNKEDGTPYMVCVGKKTSADVFTDSFSASADESSLPATSVDIFTPKGLASLKVTITGGNTGFAGATGSMQDLEIIGSEDLGDIFSGVEGAELPNEGDTEYTFPLYAFYSMIQMFGPTDSGKAHEFYMVAKDQEGNTLSATIKIIVTQ